MRTVNIDSGLPKIISIVLHLIEMNNASHGTGYRAQDELERKVSAEGQLQGKTPPLQVFSPCKLDPLDP
jgi:hypothetical protein